MLKIQQDNDLQGNNRDRELLARIVREDRGALEEMFRNYHPRLFKFLFRLTRDYDVADELVNDVMLAVWRSAASFRGAAKVSTWIFGIAYRKAMSRFSRKNLKLVPDFDLDTVTASGNTDIEQEDWVRAGIEALPPAQQASVILVFYVGLSYEEAAAIADCPVNTIKTRMFHARRKLRDILDTVGQPDNSRRGADHA